jgi:hypothetical protein
VNVGGKNLNLYGSDFISLFTSVTATNINITLDNLTFSGRKIPPVYLNDVNKDITISRGLRISDVNSQLLFHLPNETITNNTSPSMITIPYGTDFADVVKIIQNINSIFKFNTDSNGLNPSLYVYDNNNTKILFKIDRTKSIIQLGGTNTQINIDRANESLMLGSSSNFIGNVKINANELNIYINKIKFYIGSLSNFVLFSTSLSGIKYTYNSNPSWEINIPYNLNCFIETKLEYDSETQSNVNVPDYFNISTLNPIANALPKEIIIPYGLNMGLSSTEFSVYDDDETKNITFPKGLRMVTDGNYLRAWKPGTVVGADLKDQIQINYGFRVHAVNPCLLFHKPGDTIDTNLNSPNEIQMPWGFGFTSDDTYLTIYKPGDPTKGIKLAWQTL